MLLQARLEKPMTYADFQEQCERDAGAEYNDYMRRSAAGLIADAKAGRYGELYQLWRAIAARATLPLAGRVLLEVLHRDDPYLVRYHAAEALLALLGTTELEPIDLAESRADRAANLETVGRMLEELGV
jgi:hypothetical protein